MKQKFTGVIRELDTKRYWKHYAANVAIIFIYLLFFVYNSLFASLAKSIGLSFITAFVTVIIVSYGKAVIRKDAGTFDWHEFWRLNTYKKDIVLYARWWCGLLPIMILLVWDSYDFKMRYLENVLIWSCVIQTPLAFLLWFFIPREKFASPDYYGSARWATDEERAAYLQRSPSKILLGIGDEKTGYWFDGQEHLLTIAPTRSGKGTCAIIPNLLHLTERSVLCIDPKGENAQITARHRKTCGEVHIIDPFNESGLHNCNYNPLAGLDPNNPDFVDNAATLAAAIIITPSQSRDPHFDNAARYLLRGLIMLAVAAEPPERQNLVTVREYLTYPSERFESLLKVMSESTEADGAISSTANVFLGKNSREAASILSTAQEQTGFLDSPYLRNTLKSSDFAFSSLKEKIATVYLVLPQSRLESHGRWLRLLIGIAIQDMERTRKHTQNPVLFMLDEFASIGDMPVIKTSYALMAGYGVQIWAFVQNWGQLLELYDKGAHTFAANAAVTQVFNVNDELTAKYVSDLLGEHTTKSTNKSTVGTTINYSHTYHKSKLSTPDEVMNLPSHCMIIKMKNVRPFYAAKTPYYEHAIFSGLYDKADLSPAENKPELRV